jgi:hypothetical protein
MPSWLKAAAGRQMPSLIVQKGDPALEVNVSDQVDKDFFVCRTLCLVCFLCAVVFNDLMRFFVLGAEIGCDMMLIYLVANSEILMGSVPGPHVAEAA